MEQMGDESGKAGELRRRAETLFQARFAEALEDPGTMTPHRVRNLVHQLQVHQIELEMQNEELRRAQAELGEARARYFDLYNLAPLGYCTLDSEGLILEANLTLLAGNLGNAGQFIDEATRSGSAHREGELRAQRQAVQNRNQREADQRRGNRTTENDDHRMFADEHVEIAPHQHHRNDNDGTGDQADASGNIHEVLRRAQRPF